MKVTGKPASKGVVSGKVIWLGDVRADDDKFILLAQETTPNIMELLIRASGIVTRHGGVLSHAAIVSREFGIPCAVGVSELYPDAISSGMVGHLVVTDTEAVLTASDEEGGEQCQES